MAAIEMLCLLTPATLNYEPFNSTGNQELTKTEIAGMLSKLERPAQLLAWAKYMQDEQSANAFKFHMIQYSVGIANTMGWKILRGKPHVYNLGALVAYELINEGILTKNMSNREKAKRIGISKSSWSETWQDRRNQLFEYGQNLDYQIRQRLKKQITI